MHQSPKFLLSQYRGRIVLFRRRIQLDRVKVMGSQCLSRAINTLIFGDLRM